MDREPPQSLGVADEFGADSGDLGPDGHWYADAERWLIAVEGVVPVGVAVPG